MECLVPQRKAAKTQEDNIEAPSSFELSEGTLEAAEYNGKGRFGVGNLMGKHFAPGGYRLYSVPAACASAGLGRCE
jgi:hypothetical protein